MIMGLTYLTHSRPSLRRVEDHEHAFVRVVISPPKGVMIPMAKTKKGTKYVEVSPYTRKDGTKVPRHDRSTPRPAKRSTRRSGR